MRCAISAAALILAACGSSAASAPACDPDGTYTVSPHRTGGTCPDAATFEDPYTVTVDTGADGTTVHVGYGVSGIVCSGELKGCKATLACQIGLKEGGSGTIQVAWAFSATGLKGTTSRGYSPTGIEPCNVEYDEAGTKK